MKDQERDIATLIEDVKVIKAILQNEDAPLPRIWLVAWTVGPVLALAGILQYALPFYRQKDFDGLLLWLWIPAFCVALPLVLAFLSHEVGRTGKGFLGQGRVRHLLFARFVIPPAALVIVWLLSRHPFLSLEGSVLLVLAIWLTAIEQVFPAPFRFVPVGFFIVGLAELGFQITGPEITLGDILLVAANLGVVGYLFWRRAGGR